MRYRHRVSGFLALLFAIAPFVPMAILLFIGTFLWLKVDAAKEVRPDAAALAPEPALDGLRSA